MWPHLPADERIRELEDELYLARSTVLSLLPEATQALARKYYSCETRRQAREWEEELVEHIVESAVTLSAEEGSYWRPRAYCPLCGDGSSAPYEQGFAMPEGLRRHLAGSMNTGRCSVTEVLMALARDHWRPRFQESDAREEGDRKARQDERRKTENQFITGPAREPLLLDENLPSFGNARDSESLSWAEDRVKGLGFTERRDGLSREYTRPYEDFVVYADVREAGRLTFRLYMQTSHGARSRRRPMPGAESTFVPDNWKHDLNEKLEARLKQAAELLRTKGKGGKRR